MLIKQAKREIVLRAASQFQTNGMLESHVVAGMGIDRDHEFSHLALQERIDLTAQRCNEPGIKRNTEKGANGEHDARAPYCQARDNCSERSTWLHRA